MCNPAKEKAISYLESTPRPPEDMIERSVTPEEIMRVESKMGLGFPEELKQWLYICNGSYIGPGGVYGIRPDIPFLSIEENLKLNHEWESEKVIPIAGDGCGNTYVILSIPVESCHPVIFMDHESHDVNYCVASGLWQFLAFLFEKEVRETGWPFDREKVLENDLQMVKLESLMLMPWIV